MNDRIKILHVVISLEPGGMENGVVNLARLLNPTQFETHICCLERGGPFVQRLPQPENVYVLGKQPGFHFSASVQLSKVVKKINPDVIHSHNLGPLIYSGFAKLLAPRPIVHGEHSLLTDEECSPRRIRQRKVFYRFCKKVHTVSEGLRRQLIDLGLPKEKIVPLINGVDTDRFAPGSRQAARRDLRLAETAKIVGVVGRFGAFKRHALLLEAFERIAAHDQNIHLLIVGGGGPEEKKVRAQAEASPVSAQIHFAGFQNDLPLYYRALDLLVVPSINEGLSNAVLESMACGVPVLANNTCGNDEVIISGENGIVADLGTVAKLSSEMQKMLSDSRALQELGGKAREHISKSFSISKMLYNYELLYREAAAK